MALTEETAAKMIRAAEDRARTVGIGIATAIVDGEGRLFAFSRMSTAPWISIETAQAKAFTGALFRQDGPDLIKKAPENLAMHSAIQRRGLFAAASVTTIIDHGVVFSSIGCSGGTDEQDGQCARAARDVYIAAQND